MDRIGDYIRWMSDFSVASTGLQDADAVVLCALAYIDMDPVFEDGASVHKVRDCLKMVRENRVRACVTSDAESYPEIVRIAAGSRRFGELTMSHYTDIYRQDPPVQFSAVCFSDDTDISFLAYRGTDSSLAGWKEDIMISFTRTEAQEMALQYAEEHIESGRRWYIGGHSKGGNLALYAASLLSEEKWAFVEKMYLLDGPGFCPDVLDVSATHHIDSRTKRIIPQFSVVGMLFEPKMTDTRIIRSFNSGFMEHSIISWGIDHGKLAPASSTDATSSWINESIRQWWDMVPPEDRGTIVNEIFDALQEEGFERLEDITSSGRTGMEALLKRIREISKSSRDTLTELPKIAVRYSLQEMREKVSETMRLLGLKGLSKKEDSGQEQP